MHASNTCTSAAPNHVQNGDFGSEADIAAWLLIQGPFVGLESNTCKRRGSLVLYRAFHALAKALTWLPPPLEKLWHKTSPPPLLLLCAETTSRAGASKTGYEELRRNMSRVKHVTSRMRAWGKSVWYVLVYFAMCFKAAPFHEKTSIKGVSGAGLER